jgi:membrane protein insertase Oxa1/YidC/SpoIIIJ
MFKMKNLFLRIKNKYKVNSVGSCLQLLSLTIIALFPYPLLAQIQKGLPKPTDPVDPSKTSDLIIFIILPIIVLILFFFWRRAKKNRRGQ